MNDIQANILSPVRIQEILNYKLEESYSCINKYTHNTYIHISRVLGHTIQEIIGRKLRSFIDNRKSFTHKLFLVVQNLTMGPL